ncbi:MULTISPECIES: L,D-transpeptidase family protein [unclassified Acidovorax]|uniref:L,D-transpeptidase family protein n=1 Tax=unclassified Acidovorax TaxID=2684926 RepID=UPI001C450E8E|nr:MULTISPECIES: L,D-transpeptidase family protein [unclassified Acidovorax]MBV7429114.1 L,D-transpeptidase family protein [Acidovorax sp. sif0732]MBV7450940.1 L,D-transpeptidase family protein [Acidovorax sp. sif0715]
MLVALSARSRPAVAGALCLAALLHAAPVLPQSAKSRGAAATTSVRPMQAAGSTAPALRDGQAEARLMGVYQLIAEGRHREALAQAEALARDYPNFQLAQLVVGDLLMARTRPIRRLGDVPEPDSARSIQTAATLEELRNESRQRVDAQRSRPPAHTIPAQFLELSPRSRHAIAVDASRSRLYLFENTPKGLQLVADYYASVGKLGIEKNLEGDQRTPLGVYFITSRLDPATLKDFYGAGALPINYPNPLDQSRGKTGGGIWLHGTPPDQFARAPLATDGCLVLANPDLERILRTVEPRSTPVVIARQLQWVAPHAVQADRKSFDAVLNAWRSAKTEGDMSRLMGFYAPDFQSYRKKPLQEWSQVLQAETRALRGRELHLKDKSYLRWTDSADTMVVTFGEVAAGARTGPVKRQYWARRGQQWQIFFEGVIG